MTALDFFNVVSRFHGINDVNQNQVANQIYYQQAVSRNCVVLPLTVKEVNRNVRGCNQEVGNYVPQNHTPVYNVVSW